MAMIEEMAKEAIDKLEQYVKTCNPAAVKYASLSTSLTVALEPDTMNVSEKGKLALRKIDTLGKDFADKCSCIKK
jgi:hypothetical protein